MRSRTCVSDAGGNATRRVDAFQGRWAPANVTRIASNDAAAYFFIRSWTHLSGSGM
jgi:hypothetical protein